MKSRQHPIDDFIFIVKKFWRQQLATNSKPTKGSILFIFLHYIGCGRARIRISKTGLDLPLPRPPPPPDEASSSFPVPLSAVCQTRLRHPRRHRHHHRVRSRAKVARRVHEEEALLERLELVHLRTAKKLGILETDVNVNLDLFGIRFCSNVHGPDTTLPFAWQGFAGKLLVFSPFTYSGKARCVLKKINCASVAQA